MWLENDLSPVVYMHMRIGTSRLTSATPHPSGGGEPVIAMLTGVGPITQLYLLPEVW